VIHDVIYCVGPETVTGYDVVINEVNEVMNVVRNVLTLISVIGVVKIEVRSTV
jgi:hypothetical protein